jgi:hypothetical protein
VARGRSPTMHAFAGSQAEIQKNERASSERISTGSRRPKNPVAAAPDRNNPSPVSAAAAATMRSRLVGEKGEAVVTIDDGDASGRRSVSVRGVNPRDLRKYISKDEQLTTSFSCLDGVGTVTSSQINDDYCKSELYIIFFSHSAQTRRCVLHADSRNHAYMQATAMMAVMNLALQLVVESHRCHFGVE